MSLHLICIQGDTIHKYLADSAPLPRLFLLELPGRLGSTIWFLPLPRMLLLEQGSPSHWPHQCSTKRSCPATGRGPRRPCSAFRLPAGCLQQEGKEGALCRRSPRPRQHPQSSVFSPIFSCLLTSHACPPPSGIRGDLEVGARWD